MSLKTVALVDSPLELEFQGYSDGDTTALSIAERVKEMKNNRMGENIGLISEACLYKGTEQWKCIIGEVFLKYNSEITVIIADQYDHRMLTAQLGKSFGSRFDYYSLDQSQKDYVNSYADKTREYLNNFDFPGADPNTVGPTGFKGAIFSPSCGSHATITTGEVFNLRTDEEGIFKSYSAMEIINESIGLAFGPVGGFSNYDCTGKTCSDQGVIVVEDKCVDYRCNKYCANTYKTIFNTETEYVSTEQEAAFDSFPFIIAGAALAGCIVFSLCICCIVKTMRHGEQIKLDTVEERIDTDMSQHKAWEHSASDFEHNEEKQAQQKDSVDAIENL